MCVWCLNGAEGVWQLPHCPFGAGDCYPAQPERLMKKLLKPRWKWACYFGAMWRCYLLLGSCCSLRGEQLCQSHEQSQLWYHIWYHLVLDEDECFFSFFVPQPLHRALLRNDSSKKLNLFYSPGDNIPKKGFSKLQWCNLKESDQPFILLKHLRPFGRCAAVRLWNINQNKYPTSSQYTLPISQQRRQLLMAWLESYVENEWPRALLTASAWFRLELQNSPAHFFSPSSQFWLTGLELVPCEFYSHVLWVYVLMKHSTEMFEGCVLCAWISSPMLGLRTGLSFFLLFSGLLTDLISSLTDGLRECKF